MKSGEKTVGYAVIAGVILCLGLQSAFGGHATPVGLTIQRNGQAAYLALTHEGALAINAGHTLDPVDHRRKTCAGCDHSLQGGRGVLHQEGRTGSRRRGYYRQHRRQE